MLTSNRKSLTDKMVKPEYVYFIQEKDTELIKIGTTNNLMKRLYQLRVANARGLILLGYMPGNIKTERLIQQQFKHLKIQGEWFKSSDEILSFISENTKDSMNLIIKDSTKFNNPGSSSVSNFSKGGRGKIAPYKSTHCRIPEPIKPTVESLSAAYKILVSSDDEISCENLLKSVNEAISNLGEAEEEIKRLKLELALSKTKIEVLESEREFAITNLLTVFSLGSRDGVKMKAAIAIAIPEVKKRYEASKK